VEKEGVKGFKGDWLAGKAFDDTSAQTGYIMSCLRGGGKLVKQTKVQGTDNNNNTTICKAP